MADTTTILMDTRYRTITHTVFNGTNSNNKFLDVSTLVGYVNDESRVNLKAINWSIPIGGPVDIRWGNSGVIAMTLNGQGKYGGADGGPALVNNYTTGAAFGDCRLHNTTTSQGFFVCVFHKVDYPAGSGIGWSGDD